MIRQLTGKIVDIRVHQITIDINGVGYTVATNIKLPDSELNSEIILHTHLAVRENALDLYGFREKKELEIFELLLSLPKIGPKSGLQIMTQADVALIKKAVLSQDAVYLSKMSGIGKKSAEKIVLGLKDKFVFDAEDTEQNRAHEESGHADIVDALITLGYGEQVARETANELTKTSPEIKDTRVLIKEALKIINK